MTSLATRINGTSTVVAFPKVQGGRLFATSAAMMGASSKASKGSGQTQVFAHFSRHHRPTGRRISSHVENIHDWIVCDLTPWPTDHRGIRWRL